MEAYRVIRAEGSLVVGLALEGAYQKENCDWEGLGTQTGARGLYRSGIGVSKEHPKLFNLASRARHSAPESTITTSFRLS